MRPDRTFIMNLPQSVLMMLPPHDRLVAMNDPLRYRSHATRLLSLLPDPDVMFPFSRFCFAEGYATGLQFGFWNFTILRYQPLDEDGREIPGLQLIISLRGNCRTGSEHADVYLHALYEGVLVELTDDVYDADTERVEDSFVHLLPTELKAKVACLANGLLVRLASHQQGVIARTAPHG